MPLILLSGGGGMHTYCIAAGKVALALIVGDVTRDSVLRVKRGHNSQH